jgi:ATP-binding cassette subfamily E protein 1
MADQVVVYEGTPGIDCTASSPQVRFPALFGLRCLFLTRVCCKQGLLEGMNQFLRQMEITFRRDPENFRPRINKMDRCGGQRAATVGNKTQQLFSLCC